jgi:uncharacterized circularly permuted ATP-grasp superfamily protein
MNSLQIMNILTNDPFSKTVLTDILPSDRLPREIIKGPRGYILNTAASDMPGSHWVAMYLTEDGKGEFWDSYDQAPEFYNQNFTQTLRYIYMERKNFASPFIRRV